MSLREFLRRARSSTEARPHLAATRTTGLDEHRARSSRLLLPAENEHPIVLGTVSGAETRNWYDSSGATDTSTSVVVGAGGILISGPLLMILFRQKYPRWWFDWNLELTRFSSRVTFYGALLDDRYPSTDEPQSLRLDMPYPTHGPNSIAGCRW